MRHGYDDRWGCAPANPANGRRRLRGLAALAPCLLLSVGCAQVVVIVSPPTGTQLPADGTASVTIQFLSALDPSAAVTVTLLAGVDTDNPTFVDVTSLFLPAQGHWGGVANASADVTPADGITEGRNWILVSLDLDGSGSQSLQSGSLISWEPDIDASTADRCEVLDSRHCLLPFPSDFFTTPDATTDTGLRVDFELDSMVENVRGVHVDPTEWNRNDGFSPGAMILAHVPGIDLVQTGAALITDIERSLDPNAPFVILDADTLERKLFWAELDSLATTEDERSLILRPGKNLEDGHTYIVALRNVRDTNGDPIPPKRGFEIFRDGIPTFIPEVEARRDEMEQLFATLADAGVAREDLHLAWKFTVISKRSLSERLVHMRDEAFGELGGDAPSFQVTDVSDDHNADVLRRIDGTFEVPLYLTNGGASGSQLVYGVDGLPEQTGTFTANFRCIVPRAAVPDPNGPAVPARISLYGHGLLGSHTEVGASHVEDMGNEHNIVFCATDWIGMASDDVVPTIVQIIGDFSLFPFIPDRLQQAYLNTLYLGRLMKHPNGLSSDAAFQAGTPPGSVIDGSDLFYDGNSQGGIAGGGVSAFAQDWTRAVLGVTGMNYSTLLRRSVDFDPFLGILALNYDGELRHSLVIALAQMLWDRSETNGHANHLTSDPYPGTPPKKILMQVAFGDFQVANVTAEVEARTIGANVHQPALGTGKHWETTPFFGIPAVPSDPFDGSALVYWDSGNLAPPNGNLTPGALSGNESACAASRDGDPHECPRRDPDARIQKSEFLMTSGAVVDVCAGAPCVEP